MTNEELLKELNTYNAQIAMNELDHLDRIIILEERLKRLTEHSYGSLALIITNIALVIHILFR